MDRWVFIALFFLISTIYVGTFPQGSVPKWEVVYILCLYCAVRGVEPELRSLSFIGLALVSLLWSDDPRAGALSLQKLVACAIIAWWVAKSQIEERHITYALAASFPVVAWLVVSGEYYGSFGNENFVTEWIILCLPWLGWAALPHNDGGGHSRALRRMDRSRWKFLVLRSGALAFGSGAICYLIAFNNSRIEYFVLFTGVLTLLWLFKERAWAIGLFCGGLGGVIGGDIAMDSVVARIEFSINSLFMWLAEPVYGHGFGSFNYEYPRFMVHSLIFPSLGESMGPTNFAGAAHNEYLQILCELGVIGLILALWCVWRPWKWSAASVCLGLGMILALINFPFQNPATAFLLSVSFGLWLRSQSASEESASGALRRILRSLSPTRRLKTP